MNWFVGNEKSLKRSCLLHAAIIERGKHVDPVSPGWTTPNFQTSSFGNLMSTIDIFSSTKMEVEKKSSSIKEFLLERIAFGILPSCGQDNVVLRALIQSSDTLNLKVEPKLEPKDTGGLGTSKTLLAIMRRIYEKDVYCDDVKKKDRSDQDVEVMLEDLKHYACDIMSKFHTLLDSEFFITKVQTFGDEALQFSFLKEKKQLTRKVRLARQDLQHVIDVVENKTIYPKTCSLLTSFSRGLVPKSWLENDKEKIDLRHYLEQLNQKKRWLETWSIMLSRSRRLLPSKDRETVFDAVRIPRSIQIKYLDFPETLIFALRESVYRAVRASGQASSTNFSLNDVVSQIKTTRFLRLENVPVHEQRTLGLPQILYHIYIEGTFLVGASWSRDQMLVKKNEAESRSFPLLVMTFQDKSPAAMIKKNVKEPWHPPPAKTVDKRNDDGYDDDNDDGKEDRMDGDDMEANNVNDEVFSAPMFFFDLKKNMRYLGRVPLKRSGRQEDEDYWTSKGVRVICKKVI